MSGPDPDRVLLAEAAIGADAADFMRSELGRTMVGLSRKQAIDAMRKLKKVSPWRRRAIRQLQDDIALAEMFESWLQTLVVTGKRALQEYDRRQSNDYSEDGEENESTVSQERTANFVDD